MNYGYFQQLRDRRGCLACNAQPGEPCRALNNGLPIPGIHPARRNPKPPGTYRIAVQFSSGKFFELPVLGRGHAPEDYTLAIGMLERVRRELLEENWELLQGHGAERAFP